jgi:hypothetical protein
MIFAKGQRLSRLDEALGTVRVAVEIHVASSSAFHSPMRREKNAVRFDLYH